MRTLPRDIDQSVVDDYWHDDVFLAARFAFAIQFTDSAVLRGSMFGQRGCGKTAAETPNAESTEAKPRRKHSASESRFIIHPPFGFVVENL